MSSAPSAQQPARSGNNSNWVFVVAIVAILMVAMWTIRSILLLIFASIVLVILFTMPMRWFMKLNIPVGGKTIKISRTWSIVLTLVLAAVVVGALALPLLAMLIDQFGTLFNTTLPTGIDRVMSWWDSGRVLNTIPFLENVDLTSIIGQPVTPTYVLGTAGLDIFNVPLWWSDAETARSIVLVVDPTRQLSIDTNTFQQIATQVINALGTVGGSVIPILGGAANVLLNLLIVLFISLYFLAEPQRYIDRVILYTPVRYRKRMQDILHRMDEAIRAWLRVTGVSMLAAGLMTGGLLALLGIQQWAALGTLAGVGSFIPNFGTLLALIPALLVGAVQAPDKVLLIVIIVYGVTFVQSQILSPILANEDMKMPPVLILLGQIVFGIFFGFLGIMFAVPITAILLVVLDEAYVKDVLGDKKSVPDENVVFEGN